MYNLSATCVVWQRRSVHYLMSSLNFPPAPCQDIWSFSALGVQIHICVLWIYLKFDKQDKCPFCCSYAQLYPWAGFLYALLWVPGLFCMLFTNQKIQSLWEDKRCSEGLPSWFKWSTISKPMSSFLNCVLRGNEFLFIWWEFSMQLANQCMSEAGHRSNIWKLS